MCGLPQHLTGRTGCGIYVLRCGRQWVDGLPSPPPSSILCDTNVISETEGHTQLKNWEDGAGDLAQW